MAKSVLLSSCEWAEVVECRLGSSDFEVVDSKERPLGVEIGGFLGEHRLAEVTVRAPAGRGQARTLNFFIKSVPLLDSQKVITEAASTFKKEVQALSDLFVRFRRALKAPADMPWTCDCYLVRPELIVLEDLDVQGFKTIGTREEIGFDHAALVLKALANLHSAALIYEESQPRQPFRLNAAYPELLRERFFVCEPEIPNHPGLQWMETSLRGIQCLIELVQGEEEYLKISHKLDKTLQCVFDLQLPSEKYRNVVCHGDLWRNNILFRVEKDKPVAVQLVDFQVIRAAPPANDVMCFLYLSTDRNFRKQFESELLAMYHAHLSENLKHHGFLAEDVLPWDEFKESCEFYRKLGVFLSSFYKQIILMKEQDMGELLASSENFENAMTGDRKPLITRVFKKDEEFREKITDIIEEVIQHL